MPLSVAERIMHGTIDIDDVLVAARTLGTGERKPADQVVTELLREALQTRTGGRTAVASGERFGFRPIPAGGVTVTNDVVNRIRDRLAGPRPHEQRNGGSMAREQHSLGMDVMPSDRRTVACAFSGNRLIRTRGA